MQTDLTSASRRYDRLLALAALVAAIVFLSSLGTPMALGAPVAFRGLDVTFTDSAGMPETQAGAHPSAWTTTIGVATVVDPGSGEEIPEQEIKDLLIELPPGLIGTPGLIPHCARPDFLAESCPGDSAVGFIDLTVDHPNTSNRSVVYNLDPPPGVAADLGFTAKETVPVTIEVGLNPDPPYNLVASLTNISQAAAFYGSVLTIWGTPGGVPFLTLPRTCNGPLETTFKADSWKTRGIFGEASVFTHDDGTPPKPLGLDGCGDLGFSPQVAAAPTTDAAEHPSGLDLSLDVDDKGLGEPDGLAQSNIKRMVLALPEGMSVNPAVAEGLDVCGEDDFERETLAADPGAGCPKGSKIGTVEVRTPLFDEPVDGSLFVATPYENRFHSLLALYLVFKDPALGVAIKQAAKVELDPRTGRLVTTLDGLPQLPFSHFAMHFRDGPRSPLASPSACGAYDIEYRLTPWSGGPPVSGTDDFTIDHGCGERGFGPRLSAGVVIPVAGAPSPFALRLTRGDGEQNISGFSATLPAGLTARFAQVPPCPEPLAVTGACPEASRVGSASIAAGVGALPLWIPREGEAHPALYLAGPYEGAPFSLVATVPARAGPLDLGTAVTRAAIFVDPATAQARIRLDPLPQIRDGIPIAYRAIHFLIDRPGFVVNPTSCAVSAVQASVTSSTGTIAPASDRFKVGGCGSLAFKPKVGLRLLGPTHRGAHPRLRTVLTSRRGDANIRRAAATLPATELLDNRRIGTVCTMAQFDAGKCPAGSVYGHAKAWTPLLDRPLEGPVYLRASKTRLPELVASLRGQIDLDLVSRIDSVGGRLRTTLQALPDAPLRKVVLTMRGGKRGLLVNTGGLCAGAPRAAVGLNAQNGRVRHLDPVVKTDCGKKRK